MYRAGESREGPLLSTRQERGFLFPGRGSLGPPVEPQWHRGNLLKPGTRRSLPSLPPSTSMGLGLAAGGVVSASSADGA